MDSDPATRDFFRKPRDRSELDRLAKYGDDAFCLFGDYVVLALPADATLPFRLGEGAFGITFKARHRIIGEEVALKILKFDDEEDPRFMRFQREATALSVLHHAHIAAYKHVGICEGVPYCAMEFCGGGNLQGLANRRGGFDAPLVLLVGKQLCSALEHAHRKNFIHRDIKPENVMVGTLEDGQRAIKLVDFGLAKAFETEGGEASVAASLPGFKGTKLFASPEQFREREIDHRSDLYSLGMTLWYLHAGEKPRPFRHKSEAEVSSLHLNPQRFDLDEVDSTLRPVLERLLENDPHDRFADATKAGAAFADALRELERDADHSFDLEELLGEIQCFAGATLEREGLTRDERTLDEAYPERDREPSWESVVGPVYRARAIEGDATVALAVIDFGASASEELRADAREDMSRQVARHEALLGTASSPQGIIVPRVISWFSDDHVGVECDWVEGITLQELLKERHRLGLDELRPLLKQLAEALDFLDDRGLPTPAMSEWQIFVTFPDGMGEKSRDELLHEESLRSWPAIQVKIFPLRFRTEIEQSLLPLSSVTIGGVADQGSGRETPAALFAARIYRLIGGAPVAGAAFTSPGAYSNIRGLGPEANRLLQKTIAGRVKNVGCLPFLKDLVRLEGLALESARAHGSPRAAKPKPKPKPVPKHEPASTGELAGAGPVPSKKRRLLAVGIPLLALAAVGIAFALIGPGNKNERAHPPEPGPGPGPQTGTDPAPARKPEPESEPKLAAEPKVPPVPVPVPVPKPDPDPDPGAMPPPKAPAEERAGPGPSPPPADPAQRVPRQKLFNERLTLMLAAVEALERANNTRNAAAAIEALEPQFIALAKKMKEAGPPTEGEAEVFYARLEKLRSDAAQRSEAAEDRMLGFDPDWVKTLDPSVRERLEREKGHDIDLVKKAMSKVNRHLEEAWPLE